MTSTRPDIWDAFQDRFGIPEIGEFYGATEGNISLINHARTKQDRGACGRQGWLLRRLMGGKIVKFDIEKEEPIRDKNGMRRPCAWLSVHEVMPKLRCRLLMCHDVFTRLLHRVQGW